MSRIVTIDCTSNEIRIAVGSKGLTGVSVEHLVSCPLELSENEDLIGSPKTLAAIQALLKKVGVKAGDAIVCVGRGSIELRALTLPTVDRNELPEMVRFAAQRHFANVGDNWPIDFVTMPSSQENMTECLAASMNPALIERVHKVLEACGLTLTHLVLRPMVSATMAVIKQPQLASSVVLILDLFRDEADMAVVENGQVVFMRNVRFSVSNSAVSKEQVLTGEIKRTMIAAASQRPNLNVEQIRIWGNESQHSDLCQSLSLSLKVPVSSLDPFQLFETNASVRTEAGEDSGRFAATLGALLLSQVSDRLIDFSNPRKRVEKSQPVLLYAFAGTAAAVALLGGFAWYWMSHSGLDQEIVALNTVIKGNEDTIKLTAKKVSDWEKVEKFLRADHQWLDELEFLSKNAAGADRAIFDRTTFATDSQTGTSTISTKFIAKKGDEVPQIRAAFSDAQHSVTGKKLDPSKINRSNQDFPWEADLAIKIPPTVVGDPRFPPPSKTVSPPATKGSQAAAPAPQPAPSTPEPAPSTPEPVPNTESPSDKQAVPSEPSPSEPLPKEPLPKEPEKVISQDSEVTGNRIGTGA